MKRAGANRLHATDGVGMLDADNEPDDSEFDDPLEDDEEDIDDRDDEDDDVDDEEEI